MTFEEHIDKLQSDLDMQVQFIKTCVLQGLCTKQEANKAEKKVKDQFKNDLHEAFEYAVLRQDDDPILNNMYQGRSYA